MASWDPVGLALIRGGLRGVGLPARALTDVLQRLDVDRARAVAVVNPVLEACAGAPAPRAPLSSAGEVELDNLASEAWQTLPEPEQRDLRNMVQLLAVEPKPAERTALVGELSDRLAKGLLRHGPLREAVARHAPLAAPAGSSKVIAPGVVLAGKFELVEKLGAGGFGQVWRARHLDLNKDVALKLMNPEVAQDESAGQRFLREVEATTAFVHKFAVQMREFGRDPERGLLYATMDLVQGKTLQQELSRGILSPQRATRLMCQVLEVLEEAHDAGLVHRDLKPANLMLVEGRDGREEIRVLDFGIAKAINSAALSGPQLTRAGTTVGTLLYMSPEQAEGASLDGRSDLYSLGVVLYQCLSNQRPIDPTMGATDSKRSFLTNLLARPARDLGEVAPHVPAPLRDAVMRALAKAPDDRFLHARSLRRTLEEMLPTLPDVVPAGGVGPAPAPASPGTESGVPTLHGAVAATPSGPLPGPGWVDTDSTPVAVASGPNAGGLLKFVLIGGCCSVMAVFLLALGLTFPFWSKALKGLLRDPQQVAQVEAARKEARELGRQYGALVGLLQRQRSTRVEEASQRDAAGEAAFEEHELTTALAAYDDSRRIYSDLLREIADEQRDLAVTRLGEWEPLLENFPGLRKPAEIERAKEDLLEGQRLSAEGSHHQAATRYMEALRSYETALRLADRAAPQIDLTSPAKDHATIEPAVKLEGSVRDLSAVELWLDGAPLELSKPQAGISKFASEIELTALGSRTVVLRARDALGRETLLKRQVTRKPIPLEVELSEPRDGQLFKTATLRVRGKVRGAVPAKSVTVGATRFTPDAEGRFDGTLDLAEGTHELEVVARGPFAEGRAKRQVVVDRTAPSLRLSGVRSGQIVYKDRLTVFAYASDATSPWVEVRQVGSRTQRVKPGRSAMFWLRPRMGFNSWTFQAVDAAGNTSAPLRISVTRRSAGPALLRPFRLSAKRYRVTRNVTVPFGQTLVIPAGYSLTFNRGVSLTVRGALRVEGTRFAKVRLEGFDWAGLTVLGRTARATISYATLTGANKKNGGAIAVRSGGFVRLSNCTVSNCKADYGGAIDVSGAAGVTSKIECSFVYFQNNTGRKDGGGAYVGSYSRGTFQSCTFYRNTATNAGGALVVSGAETAVTPVSITSTRFSSNKAKFGAGLSVHRGGNATISGGVFVGNNASSKGGGLNMFSSSAKQRAVATCTRVRFENNSATDSGGAQHVQARSHLTLNSCTIKGNRSNYGGGLNCLGSTSYFSYALVNDTVFEKNTANREGGGANINRYGDAKFRRCRFVRNSAVKYGGGVLAIGQVNTPTSPETRISLRSCTFTANTAPYRKGPDLYVSPRVSFSAGDLSSCGLTNRSRYHVVPRSEWHRYYPKKKR